MIDLSPEKKAEVESIISRYPERRAAALPVLWYLERELGELSDEVERLAAEMLALPPTAVREISTFYTMFRRPAMGKHVIQVCHTLSCALRGAADLVDHIGRRLGISPGETTADGKFTLVKVECLGSCDTAPCIQIDDKHFHDMTPEKLDRLLEKYD